MQSGQVGREIRDELQLALIGQRLQRAADIRDRLFKGKWLFDKLRLARIQPRKIEDIVDQRQKMRAAFVNVTDIFDIFGMPQGAEQGALHEFGKADDRVQGRAQFMAHGRQEGGFCFIGGIGVLKGLIQLRLVCLKFFIRSQKPVGAFINPLFQLRIGQKQLGIGAIDERVAADQPECRIDQQCDQEDRKDQQESAVPLGALIGKTLLGAENSVKITDARFGRNRGNVPNQAVNDRLLTQYGACMSTIESQPVAHPCA